MDMITKEQVSAIEDFIETNFDGILEIFELYNVGADRLAEKWNELDDKLRDKQSANATEDELSTLQQEWVRANAMLDMANGFILALLLQKINSKIFVD